MNIRMQYGRQIPCLERAIGGIAGIKSIPSFAARRFFHKRKCYRVFRSDNIIKSNPIAGKAIHKPVSEKIIRNLSNIKHRASEARRRNGTVIGTAPGAALKAPYGAFSTAVSGTMSIRFSPMQAIMQILRSLSQNQPEMNKVRQSAKLPHLVRTRQPGLLVNFY